jgi:hypothetical protein
MIAVYGDFIHIFRKKIQAYLHKNNVMLFNFITSSRYTKFKKAYFTIFRQKLKKWQNYNIKHKDQ